MSGFNISDFFGEQPRRPDHEDFWKLSNVLLKLDSGIDPRNNTPNENEQAFKARLQEIGVDEMSLTYAATQRAFRALGVTTSADLIPNLSQAILLTSVWLDAFAAGVFYERGDS